MKMESIRLTDKRCCYIKNILQLFIFKVIQKTNFNEMETKIIIFCNKIRQEISIKSKLSIYKFGLKCLKSANQQKEFDLKFDKFFLFCCFDGFSVFSVKKMLVIINQDFCYIWV